MPKISYNKSGGGKIIFDERDWLAGLNPQYGTSSGLPTKIGNGLSAIRSFDPLRLLGYASPAFNPTSFVNVALIDAVQKNLIVKGVKAYSVGGTKIFETTISNNTITPVTDPVVFPHAVASSVMEDVIVYKIGSSDYVFYSWYDGTDGDVGTYNLTATFDDDFMSTVPASGAVFNKSKPMPMIVGSDDVLYIADGNEVHAFDGQVGANGTLYKSVLKLPKEYIITGFAKYGEQLAVFAYSGYSNSFYLGKATAFFWNYLDLDLSKVIDLVDNYVSAPFEFNGIVGCFTYGKRTDRSQIKLGKLKIYNGSYFETVANYIGESPVLGGVDVVGNMIYWNSAGKIFCWGTQFVGVENIFNQIAEGSGTTSGLIKSVSGISQIISSGIDASGGMENINDNYANQAFVITALAKPNWESGKQGRVKNVIVKYGKTSNAGREILIALVDRLGASKTIVDGASAITSSNYITKLENIEKKFDDLKVHLNWTSGSAVTDAPIIDSIIVEFEQINI